MAAAVTWGPISATFTPSGGAAEVFTDLTELQFDDEINLQELLTDNNVNVNFIFGTGGKTSFSFKSTDSSLAWRTTSPPGTPGVLVIVFGKRAAGKGYVGAANKTLTASNAVMGKRSGSVNPASPGGSDFAMTAYDTGTGLFAIA